MTILKGQTVNVNHGKKGVFKETVKTVLRNGTVRTEEGSEFNTADMYNKGKGKFVDLKGGVVKKTTAAAAPAAKAERPAPPTITFKELEEKARKINGIEIESLKRKEGTVVLADGSTVAIGDISRKGKGYGADVVTPAPKAGKKTAAVKAATEKAPVKTSGVKPAAKTAAPAKTGGAVKKAKAAPADDNAFDEGALYGPAGQYETSDVRGKVIDFNGDDVKVVKTFSSGRCVLESGDEFQADEIRKRHDGRFCVYSDEYIDELKELHEQANTRAKAIQKAKDTPKPVTSRSFKKNVTQVLVGKKMQTVARVLTTGVVVMDSGLRIAIADIEQQGAKLVYGGAASTNQKAGGALPKTREVPPFEKKIVRVSEFDDDTAQDICDLLEENVRKIMAGEYDVQLVSSFAGRGTEFCTVAFSFAIADADPARIQEMVARQRAENFADDENSDTDAHQLTPNADDIPEEEEEQEEEEEEEQGR